MGKFFLRESALLRDPSDCCCFTGHRNLNPQKNTHLTEELRSAIREAYADGYRHFIAGGAYGFDMLAACAVLQIRAEMAELPGKELITLTLAIPCLGQADTWRVQDKQRYQQLLVDADEAVLLSEQTYFSGCMQQRNRYMVEHSRRCICFVERPTGGTAQTVNLAKKENLELVMLH